MAATVIGALHGDDERRSLLREPLHRLSTFGTRCERRQPRMSRETQRGRASESIAAELALRAMHDLAAATLNSQVCRLEAEGESHTSFNAS